MKSVLTVITYLLLVNTLKVNNLIIHFSNLIFKDLSSCLQKKKSFFVTHTVSCGSNNNYSDYTWILDRSKSENIDEYLKTHDIVLLRNKYPDYLTNKQKEEVLGSKNIMFTVNDDEYQEVYAHPKDNIDEFDEVTIIFFLLTFILVKNSINLINNLSIFIQWCIELIE